MIEQMLWVEKYRPKTIEECILPDGIKETFQEFVNKKEIPNLLLSGTAGVGNGSSANLTGLAKGTGVGPTSDVVNKWLPVNINGDTGWIPFFK